MKWSEPLTKPTREYMGGILAGLGLGAFVWQMVFRNLAHVWSFAISILAGFTLIGVGAGLARAGQRLNKKKQRPANQ